MCNPAPQEIVVGIFAVVIACVLGAYSFYWGCSKRNPLYYVGTLGAIVFVAGIIGQRAVVLNGLQAGCTIHSGGSSAWSANISWPIFGWHVDLVAVVGLFIGLASFLLVTLVERVGVAASTTVFTKPLEDDDTV